MIEEDSKIERPSSQPGSMAKILTGNLERVHVFIGPKTPAEAEADAIDDDVTQFKRVHIVAGPNNRRPANGTPEPLAGTDSESDMNTNRRPPLPAPTESSYGFPETDIVSVNSLDSRFQSYTIPEDGTPITIRTSRRAPLPAPYQSIVNAINPGERVLTSIEGHASSRPVLVYKHDDGQMVTMRIVFEDEEANMGKTENLLHQILTGRESTDEEVKSSLPHLPQRMYDSHSSSGKFSSMPSMPSMPLLHGDRVSFN